MTSILNCFLSLLLGIALTSYGLVHSLTQYPNPTAIETMTSSLPAIGSVLLFTLGIVAAVSGLLLLYTSTRRLKSTWRHVRSATELSPVAGRGHGGFAGSGYYPNTTEEEEWNRIYR